EFSLKLFLERTVVFEQSSSNDTYDPTIEHQDGYQKWESSFFLDLAPIKVEILNFFKGYSSDNSMDTESDEVSCKYFDSSNIYSLFYLKNYLNEVSNSEEDNPVSPIMGKLDFSYLDDYKCHF
ncbi:10731_t:CDS:2, partial [Gigaspora margarita]